MDNKMDELIEKLKKNPNLKKVEWDLVKDSCEMKKAKKKIS
jgi:hypothetical protein